MKKKSYLDQVFQEIEPKYNVINLVFVIVLYIMGIQFLFRDGRLASAVIDLVAAVIGTGIHIYRHKIRLQHKMLLTVVVLFIFSAQSLARSGFVGNGLIGLTLIIVVSMTFLDEWVAVVVSLISMSFMALLTVLAFTGIFDLELLDMSRYTDPIEWLYQTISVVLFVVVTYFSIYTIRKMLLVSIEKLSKVAYIDQLTGLSNRNYFLDQLPYDQAGSVHKPTIVAILDILNFRLINTFYGVEKGDQLLKAIAHVATQQKTNGLTISRIGSNEFALFAVGWDKEALSAYFQRCMDQLFSSTKEISVIPHQRFIIAYKPFSFTPDAFMEAFKDVTIALKYAKEYELQGLVQFNESMFLDYEKREMMRSKIEQALHNDEFHVHFQGKWHLKEQRFCGYEALARWTHAEGTVSPGVFIPIINKSSYMSKFSGMIIKKALADFEVIQSHVAYTLTLSLNISPLFFLKVGFVSFVVAEIDKTSLSPSQIILEITEDVFIDDYDALNQKIIALKQAGISVSLDDFGSGYSSLNHLNNIDIDELKMDKSIIDGILDNPKSKILYQMVVALASKMGCELVAEGVETEEQYRCLEELGCDSIQGYYFSRPQCQADVIESFRVVPVVESLGLE